MYCETFFQGSQSLRYQGKVRVLNYVCKSRYFDKQTVIVRGNERAKMMSNVLKNAKMFFFFA